MKRAILALLSVLVLVGCYEKDPIPEGLTEDNFYIGTFKIGEYTVELGKSTVSLSDEAQVLLKADTIVEHSPMDGEFVPKVFFNSSKDFEYSMYTMQTLTPQKPPVEERSRILEVGLKGSEKGFSFSFRLYEHHYPHDENDPSYVEYGGLPIATYYFSNYEELLPEEYSDEAERNAWKFKAVPEIEWNGKRYKSTLEAAFEK